MGYGILLLSVYLLDSTSFGLLYFLCLSFLYACGRFTSIFNTYLSGKRSCRMIMYFNLQRAFVLFLGVAGGLFVWRRVKAVSTLVLTIN